MYCDLWSKASGKDHCIEICSRTISERKRILFEMYGLTFEEFLTFKNKKYVLEKENSVTINKELIPLAEEYIKYGAYPQIVLEENEEKKETYLWQIINTYVRKDIQDIGKVRNVSGFNKLLRLLASQSGQILNVLEIANTVAMSRETVIFGEQNKNKRLTLL